MGWAAVPGGRSGTGTVPVSSAFELPSARPPEAEIQSPRIHGIEQPELLPTASGVRWPICTPPDPTRIVLVAAAKSPMTNGGDVPATPGLRWCSATQ